MIRNLMALGLLLGAAACNGDKNAGDSGDIGGDDGTGDDAGDSGATDNGGDGGTDSGTTWTCDGTFLDSEPEDEDTDVYWKDPIELEFEGDGSNAIVTLDVGGEVTDISDLITYEDGGLTGTWTPDPGLTPGSTYTMTVQCADTVAIGFSTSSYGEPMTAEASTLVGNTYYMDLPGASFKKPAGVGALMGLFLDAPILIGITGASDDSIDVLGAQGEEDELGEVTQDTDQGTWDFGTADFSTSPFFEADADEIVITYKYDGDNLEIPVTDFHVEGTFSADGSSIGGGKAWGMGDTRNLGPAVGAGDGDGAVCEYLGGFGLECETCADGGAYCLFIEAWFDDAPVLDGVTLEAL